MAAKIWAAAVAANTAGLLAASLHSSTAGLVDELDMFECMEAPLNALLQDGWGLVAWAKGRGAEAWGVEGAMGEGGGVGKLLDAATATGAG